MAALYCGWYLDHHVHVWSKKAIHATPIWGLPLNAPKSLVAGLCPRPHWITTLLKVHTCSWIQLGSKSGSRLSSTNSWIATGRNLDFCFNYRPTRDCKCEFSKIFWGGAQRWEMVWSIQAAAWKKVFSGERATAGSPARIELQQSTLDTTRTFEHNAACVMVQALVILYTLSFGIFWLVVVERSRSE